MWRTFSMVTGLRRPGTRCSRPPASPARPMTRFLGAAADGPGRAAYRADQLARVFTDRGVTFDFAGEERPFPLDPCRESSTRRVVRSAAASPARAGARAFLADVYGAQLAVRDGVIPAAWSSPARLPPRGGRHRRRERRAHPGFRNRPHPRRGGHLASARGQRAGAERRELRDLQPPGHGADLPGAVRRACGCAPSAITRTSCCRRCGHPPRTASKTRPWSCSRPVCSTPRTTSTRCSRA